MQVTNKHVYPSVAIESLELTHEASMQRLINDPLIARFTPKPYPYPEGEARREILKAVKDREEGVAYCFAILADGHFAGVCKLKDVDDTQGELGYWIGVQFWGKGIASRAARMVLEFAFSELGLEQVIAHTLIQNKASSQVLERLGFAFLREEPNTHPKWSSDARVRLYRILKTEFRMAD